MPGHGANPVSVAAILVLTAAGLYAVAASPWPLPRKVQASRWVLLGGFVLLLASVGGVLG